MVVIYSKEERPATVEIDWSVVESYTGLKSALREAVRQWKRENDDDYNPEDESGNVTDDDEDKVLAEITRGLCAGHP
jgi:hypothetical protein